MQWKTWVAIAGERREFFLTFAALVAVVEKAKVRFHRPPHGLSRVVMDGLWIIATTHHTRPMKNRKILPMYSSNRQKKKHRAYERLVTNHRRLRVVDVWMRRNPINFVPIIENWWTLITDGCNDLTPILFAIGSQSSTSYSCIFYQQCLIYPVYEK